MADDRDRDDTERRFAERIALGADEWNDARDAEQDADGEYPPLDGAGAALAGADLTGYNFANVNFAGANFTGASLAGADLSGADLSGANLEGAQLTGANLHGTQLAGSDLTDANLTNARLSEAHFGGATLAGADLRHADLTDASLATADLDGANLTNARLDNTRLQPRQLLNDTLPDDTLDRATLVRGEDDLRIVAKRAELSLQVQEDEGGWTTVHTQDNPGVPPGVHEVTNAEHVDAGETYRGPIVAKIDTALIQRTEHGLVEHPTGSAFNLDIAVGDDVDLAVGLDVGLRFSPEGHSYRDQLVQSRLVQAPIPSREEPDRDRGMAL